jgi:hypothetical protein
LTRLRVSDGARTALSALYLLLDATTSPDDFGRRALPPGVSALLELRWPRSTVSRRLIELVRHGLLDCEGGRNDHTYLLYPATRLVQRLTRRPSLRAALPPKTQEWADVLARSATLYTAIGVAKAQTAAAKAKQEAKPKATKKRLKLPAPLTAALWGDRFRDHIKSGIGGARQPTIYLKDLAILARFRRDFASDDEFDRIMQWFCTEGNWVDLRRRCKITAEDPTVAVFFGFRGSFVKQALSGAVAPTGPKRSGGAVSRAVDDTRDLSTLSF